jgi:hypothetical protein
MSGMAERGMWLRDLRRAAAESCAPRRNWRWMLASLFIGAGYGMVGGLYRLGNAPASITPEVAVMVVRTALVFFVVTWLVAIAVRFGRSLRAGTSDGLGRR